MLNVNNKKNKSSTNNNKDISVIIKKNIVSIILALIILIFGIWYIFSTIQQSKEDEMNRFREELFIITGTINRMSSGDEFDKAIKPSELIATGQIPYTFIEGNNIVTPWSNRIFWITNRDRLIFIIPVPTNVCKNIQSSWGKDNFIANFTEDYCKYGVVIFEYFKDSQKNTFEGIKGNLIDKELIDKVKNSTDEDTDGLISNMYMNN